MITLQPFTTQNILLILKLKLRYEEKGLFAPDPSSVSEAYVKSNIKPLAVYADDTPVGFLRYGQFEEDKGKYWVARLMIDKNQLKKGYIEEAMWILLDKLSKKESCRELFLSFVPKSATEQALYDKLGFENTEKIVDKEKTYVYKF